MKTNALAALFIATLAGIAGMPAQAAAQGTSAVTVTGITIETRSYPYTLFSPGSTAAAIAAFLNAPRNVPGYTNQPVAITDFTNITNHDLAGAHDQIAFHYVFALSASTTSSINVRFGIDFGYGGTLLVDGQVIDENWNDMWWNLSYTNPTQYLKGTLSLAPGPHVIELYGFENWNDGPQQAQFDSGSGWQDFTAPPPPVCTGGVGDVVWNDLNRNGAQDAGEVGISDVAVNLWSLASDGTWNPVGGTVNTDATGHYAFSALCAGSYKVVASTPEGYTPSLPLRAAADIDSNPAPSLITLAADNASDPTIDFGFYVTPVGDFMTISQGGWGAKPAGHNPGILLSDYFNFVYPASLYPSGLVVGNTLDVTCPTTVGTPTWGPYKLALSSPKAVQTFLPQGGKPVPLSACAVNPTHKISELAGEVLALTLNVDFSNAGVLQPGLANLSVVSGPLAGWTVNQVLSLGNCMLSGGTSGSCTSGAQPKLSYDAVEDVIEKINGNFEGGTTSKKFLH